VQGGFTRPHFIISESILTSAGFPHISCDTPFNLFRINLGHWTTVKLNHVVDLKDSSRIFIKALGVQSCQDFAKFLSISSSSSSLSPNIRTNLASERAYIKNKMASRELSRTPTPFSTHKHRLSPDSPSPSTPKRQRVFSDVSPAPTLPHHHMIPAPVFTRTLSPTPSTSQVVSVYSQQPSIYRPTSSRNHSQPIIKQENPFPTMPPFSAAFGSRKPRWPADFFAIDIVHCFDRIEDGTADSRVRLIFDDCFGQWVSYKKSTFYEHRKRWQTASLEIKQAALSAGHTDAGRWSCVMATTPAPRAHIKAARKRKLIDSSVDCEVIEILSDSDI
jgi:hypothetical protein